MKVVWSIIHIYCSYGFRKIFLFITVKGKLHILHWSPNQRSCTLASNRSRLTSWMIISVPAWTQWLIGGLSSMSRGAHSLCESSVCLFSVVLLSTLIEQRRLAYPGRTCVMWLNTPSERDTHFLKHANRCQQRPQRTSTAFVFCGGRVFIIICCLSLYLNTSPQYVRFKTLKEKLVYSSFFFVALFSIIYSFLLHIQPFLSS